MFRVLRNPSHDRPGNKGILQVREILTSDSKAFVSDDLLKLMYRMTKNDVQQTVLMALGYIIQRLEILQESDKKNQAKYAEQLAYFQNLLEEQQERQ
ncbi:MAG: hypothetical protein CL607_22335 [Anaerolineaceae bacterium]|nr:hypothetical protein [Anaerolineaceae bacterium]